MSTAISVVTGPGETGSVLLPGPQGGQPLLTDLWCPMARPPKPRLLAGPHTPPPLRRGDRATCRYRDADVVITSWTSAPIPWPRCCRPGTHGGGSGLLVTEELGRAVRTEPAIAAEGRSACEGRAAVVEEKTRGQPEG